MSNPLLEKLEEKINHALEIIELLRVQLEEAESDNHSLKTENTELRQRQKQWEQDLSALLNKLSDANLPHPNPHLNSPSHFQSDLPKDLPAQDMNQKDMLQETLEIYEEEDENAL